jgi:hypothetical protein
VADEVLGDSGLTALARYSSTYWSGNRSRLLIAVLRYARANEFILVRLNMPETNNMTSNMTSLEAAMSPELN